MIRDYEDEDVFEVGYASETPLLDASQQRAYDAIQEWLANSDKQTLVVGGLAGTGKTTLITRLIRPDTAVAAFTGKAVNVLAKKDIDAVTLHRLLYDFLYAKDGELNFQAKRIGALEDAGIKLVIVDEASMVGDAMEKALLKHNVKVLFVGDHGQLPPVGGGCSSCVENPDLVLDTIHRQKEGSAIIDFAYHVREGNNPFHYQSNAEVTVLAEDDLTQDHYREADMVIVATNFQRTKINNILRKDPTVPFPGEPLVILSNNYKKGVFNGQVVHVDEVVRVDADRIWIKVNDGTRVFEAPFWIDQFGKKEGLLEVFDPHAALFADFGYAMTVYKAQGSQMDHVLVWEQTPQDEKWQYTAATRAIKKLVYVPAGKDWQQLDSPNIKRLLEREKYKPPPRFAVSALELLKQKLKEREGK